MHLRSRRKQRRRGEQQRPSRSRPARSSSFFSLVPGLRPGRFAPRTAATLSEFVIKIILHQHTTSSIEEPLSSRPHLASQSARHSSRQSHRHCAAFPTPSLTTAARIGSVHSRHPPAPTLTASSHKPLASRARRDPSSSFSQAAERFSRPPLRAHQPTSPQKRTAPLHHRPNHPPPLRHPRSLICPRPPLLCLSCRRAAAGWRPGGR